jgi:glycosyltransferase involved in cell wall biosynthesis
MTRRRRIVLALSTIFKVHGGIPRFNQMLCLALDQVADTLPLDITVLSQDDAREDYEKRAPWRHARFIPGGGQLGLTRRTIAHAARTRPDALVVGILGMSPLGVLCAPFVRRGFGFVAHGVEAWAEPRLSRRVSGRRARRVFAVSRYTAEALVRAIALDPSRIRLLPNTLEPGFETLQDEDPAVPVPHDPIEILTVTRLWAEEHEKGVDHTLRAFAKLAADRPDVRYRIVGKGSGKPRYVALARELGIAERVVFEEDLSDAELADRYRRSALFVLPSNQEGFGIVYLEAMRFRRPAIGARAGGIVEVIDDGVTGLLVPYADVDALRGALDRLVADPGLRRARGEAGRRRLDAEFVFPRFRRRVEEHFREWLEL